MLTRQSTFFSNRVHWDRMQEVLCDLSCYKSSLFRVPLSFLLSMPCLFHPSRSRGSKISPLYFFFYWKKKLFFFCYKTESSESQFLWEIDVKKKKRNLTNSSPLQAVWWRCWENTECEWRTVATGGTSETRDGVPRVSVLSPATWVLTGSCSTCTRALPVKKIALSNKSMAILFEWFRNINEWWGSYFEAVTFVRHNFLFSSG